ncbi:MAG: TRAP transporter substrate-binding protein [Lachnospiraceae bacterium]|nr:TRAP transporter substrate-binding protein [Lachnospiraceae bacterium]
MKKWAGLLITLVAITGICFLGIHIRQEDRSTKDVIVLRLANNHTADYPTSQGCDYFAKAVEEATDGRIIIECYCDAALGREDDTLKQLQIGGIDFVRCPVNVLAPYAPRLNVLSLPYLYENDEHMWKVLNGDIGEQFLKDPALDANNIEGLCWYTAGSRSFYSNHLLGTFKSIQGTTIRTQDSDLMRSMVEALSATPVTVAFDDIYSAFLTGDIDVAENNIPSYVSTANYKVAPYMVLDEHVRIPEMIVASAVTMKDLSTEDQAVFRKCAKDSTKKQIEYWNAYEEKAYETALHAGCRFIDLNETQKARFSNAMKDVWKQYAADDEDLVQAIQAAAD